MSEPKESWHLDKRVPVALVLMIIVQTGGAVWWAATVSKSLEALEKRVAFNEEANRRQWDRITAADSAVQESNARLARVEGMLQQINEQLSRVADHLMRERVR